VIQLVDFLLYLELVEHPEHPVFPASLVAPDLAVFPADLVEVVGLKRICLIFLISNKNIRSICGSISRIQKVRFGYMFLLTVYLIV